MIILNVLYAEFYKIIYNVLVFMTFYCCMQGGHFPVCIKLPDFSSHFELYLRSCTTARNIIDTKRNTRAQL